MKENIETKDVQRTEYLDKNGLDMLWAKVKENAHNQVEVERNRATTQEGRIIETKADKSELHANYVSSSTFTALQEKVAANTDAISDKQDAGNYLSYQTLNNEGYYEIPSIRIAGSGGSTKTDIDPQSISVNCDYPASHTTITCDGISNTDNNANHVYATDGSIADLTQYAKKSEITAGGNIDDVQVNGVTVVENKIANIKPATKENLGVVKVGDGLNVTDGVISVSAGNYLTYDSVTNASYYISSPKSFIFYGNDQDPALSIGNNHIMVGNNNTYTYSKMLDNYIQLRADKNALNISCANITGNEYKENDPTPYEQFVLNKKGVWLYGGDDNHVLTSNASTIDITQYVLKSVYDEKIAVLEARIAALEAKHAEAA